VNVLYYGERALKVYSRRGKGRTVEKQMYSVGTG